MTAAPELRAVDAAWAEVLLVCRKCSKKLDGGFGADGSERLGKALKAGLKAAGRRRAVRVMEVGCLGLCPKRAVTVIGPGRPGVLWSVPAGMEAGDVLRAVGVV